MLCRWDAKEAICEVRGLRLDFHGMQSLGWFGTIIFSPFSPVTSPIIKDLETGTKSELCTGKKDYMGP